VEAKELKSSEGIDSNKIKKLPSFINNP